MQHIYTLQWLHIFPNIQDVLSKTQYVYLYSIYVSKYKLLAVLGTLSCSVQVKLLHGNMIRNNSPVEIHR